MGEATERQEIAPLISLSAKGGVEGGARRSVAKSEAPRLSDVLYASQIPDCGAEGRAPNGAKSA